MRKMKKINGYLVVRFNDREKQGYPQIGSFGVIDAELYTGHIDVDLGAFEYDDADTIEVAVEQARGLEAEQDFNNDPRSTRSSRRPPRRSRRRRSSPPSSSTT